MEMFHLFMLPLELMSKDKRKTRKVKRFGQDSIKERPRITSHRKSVFHISYFLKYFKKNKLK
jgi:hypothetical protein